MARQSLQIAVSPCTSSRRKQTEPVPQEEEAPPLPVAPVIKNRRWDQTNVHDMLCIFDRDWYERRYANVAAGLDPTTHYRKSGYRENRQPNRFFDPVTYRRVNPDLAHHNGDLFLHSVFYGMQEGRLIA